ncbi:hypothetical protein HN011_008534 [Eciton burchellii]|nr:hypothetical protein HN011_008534 [Eciton burchellii]
MTTIQIIPEKIMEIILSDRDITIQDFVNFSSIYTHFYNMVIAENRFWRLHFYKRWPHLENRCKEELWKGEVDFEELIQIRVECRKVLRHYLSRMKSFIMVLNMNGRKDELTNIYYGEMLLRCLKYYYLREMWQKFISRPVKQQLLEESLTFLAQWFQPK